MEDIKILNDFRFNNVKLLIRSLFKHRIHFRDFMNLALNKARIKQMDKKGIFDDFELFSDMKEQLLKVINSNNK